MIVCRRIRDVSGIAVWNLGFSKATFLSLVWVSCFLWSPDLVFSSNIEEKDKSIVDKTTESSSVEKKTFIDATALPEDAKFLAGPSLDEHLLFSNHTCSCHSTSSSSYLDAPISTDTSVFESSINDNLLSCKYEEKETGKFCDGRIFYLVSVHNNRTLSDALYLFRAIRDARNIIVIHIDAKFGLEPYYDSALHKEIEACPCGSRVEVSSVYDCIWGSWSMNLPTLWGMEKAVKEYAGKWDVFVNLSGDTLPVYSQNRIAKLFGGPLRGINFVTSIACETGLVPTSILEFPKKWHKRSHYSHEPPDDLTYVDDDGVEHEDAKVDIYFGSQWVSLTPDFCEFLIRQLARPDSLASRFRDWLIETHKLMADETFFTSMLMRYFPETIPKIGEDFFLDTEDFDDSNSDDLNLSMYAIRYERMDEHVPTSKGYFPTEQRYEVPASSGVEQPKAWGPYFLGYVTNAKHFVA